MLSLPIYRAQRQLRICAAQKSAPQERRGTVPYFCACRVQANDLRVLAQPLNAIPTSREEPLDSDEKTTTCLLDSHRQCVAWVLLNAKGSLS